MLSTVVNQVIVKTGLRIGAEQRRGSNAGTLGARAKPPSSFFEIRSTGRIRCAVVFVVCCWKFGIRLHRFLRMTYSGRAIEIMFCFRSRQWKARRKQKTPASGVRLQIDKDKQPPKSRSKKGLLLEAIDNPQRERGLRVQDRNKSREKGREC